MFPVQTVSIRTGEGDSTCWLFPASKADRLVRIFQLNTRIPADSGGIACSAATLKGSALPTGLSGSVRLAFGDAVVETLHRYAPNLKDAILGRQVLTPLDIERTTGLTEGNIFAGELALHQLFFLRPVAGWANYRTPIAGYWQCGAGTHPGGGVMGASGRNAALQILGRA